MPTSTKGRAFHQQLSHYIRSGGYTVAQLGGTGNRTTIGTIPAGSLIKPSATLIVTTTFDVVTAVGIGSTTAAGNGFILNNGIGALSAGVPITNGAGNWIGPLTGDLDVTIHISALLTGLTMPTAGAFEAIVEYIPNNDNLQRSTNFDT